MKIIIISTQGGTSNRWHVSQLAWIVLGLALLTLITLSSMIAYQFANSMIEADIKSANAVFVTDQNNSDPILNSVAITDDYYAKRLGGLQADAIRMQALIAHLADQVGLDIDDAMYREQFVQGGFSEDGLSLTEIDFHGSIDQIQSSFSQQSQLISTIQKMTMTDGNIRDAIPAGRPIDDGWVSSYYGYRVDPFNGKKVFHRGIDFAGKEGSKVMAVADGIVTWAGKRGNYGEMLEIDHGSGYVTRYAHNKSIEVKVGARIESGQTIAMMGSTGRSTGPHVHFEILRDGKSVNPYKFIKK